MIPARTVLPFLTVLGIIQSGATASPTVRPTVTPSFAERVAAEQAVLRVLAGHAGVTLQDFEARVPRAIAEERARRTLALSETLRSFWHTPITKEMLDAEVRRMTRSSAMPGRLRDRFAALGDDPVLIREVIARPVLADRLARNFYNWDRRVHAETWRNAEDLRRDLEERRIDPRTPRSGRTEVEIDLDEPPAGRPGPITEEADHLTIDVPLEPRGARWLAARYVIEKREWAGWWAENRPRFAVETVDVPHSVGVAPQDGPQSDRSRLEAEVACTPDTWSVLHGGAPDTLHDSRAVWTGSLMLVWGGQRLNASGWRYDPALDDWSPMNTDGAPPFAASPAVVWTGTKMIVWGGTRTGVGPVATGGVYDPVADTWMPTSSTGAPAARYGHTAVWTGTKMVVWGGTLPSSAATASGGIYDPALDEWSATQEAGAPAPRSDHTAVWTGGHMIVWGGCAAGPGCYGTGASYDPQTDVWSALVLAGGPPEARGRHTAVWTGTKMIVWGGINTFGAKLQTGGLYNPVSGWSGSSVVGAPTARQDHSAVWTGSRMIVFGGVDAGSAPPASGGLYDPLSDTWSATAQSAGRWRHVAVWTGSRMIVWGGYSWGGAVFQGPPTNTGARYDPASNSWTPTSRGSQPAFDQSNLTPVDSFWTGNELLVWGGSADGGRYDPATDSWSFVDTPSGVPVRGASAVWTGSKMIVWGGVTTACCLCPPGGAGPYEVYHQTGTAYDPLTNTWTPSGAGGGNRAYHEAVWTGTEMIVFGGYEMVPCSGPFQYHPGFRFNPQTGSVTSLPIGGPPYDNNLSTAGYLTDSGVLLWNGLIGPWLYHPESDSWTRGESSGTPANVSWTSYAGGRLTAFSSSSGGRYDPISDAWSPTSPQGPYRQCQNGVTGSSGAEVFWWGGGDPAFGCNGATDGGARYDPVMDDWTPTSTADAPPSSVTGAHAVWNGGQLFWWEYPYHLGFAYCMPGKGPCYRDLDGDGYGDPAAAAQCSEPGVVWNTLDCDDGDPSRGGLAGEAGGLAFTGTSSLVWNAPPRPPAASFFYDLLRSDRPDDLSGAACVATDITTPAAADAAVPAVGRARYYHVRASTCPGGALEGTLGKGTSGTPGRVGPICP
jgi:hypothetical protein